MQHDESADVERGIHQVLDGCMLLYAVVSIIRYYNIHKLVS